MINCQKSRKEEAMAVAPSALEAFHTQTDVDTNTKAVQELQNALDNGNKNLVWSLLTSKRVGPNVSFYDGFAPLHAIACRGTVRMARLLIRKGADVNQQNDAGYTPLHLCAFHRNRQGSFIAELILGHQDVNPDLTNHKGQTPLDVARLQAKLIRDDPKRELVRLLAKHSS